MPKYPHISTPSISSLEGNKAPLAGHNGSLGHLALVSDVEAVKVLFGALEETFINLTNTGSYEEFKLTGDKCIDIKKSGKNTFTVQLSKTFVEKTDVDSIVAKLNESIKKGDEQALKGIEIKGGGSIKIQKNGASSFEISLDKSFVESDVFKKAIDSINAKILEAHKKYLDIAKYEKWSEGVEDRIEKLQKDRVSKTDIKDFIKEDDIKKVETSLVRRIRRVEDLADPKNAMSFCFDDFITQCKTSKDGEDVYTDERLGIKKFSGSIELEYKEYIANKHMTCVGSISLSTLSDGTALKMGYYDNDDGIYFTIQDNEVVGVCKDAHGKTSTKSFSIEPNKWYIYKIEVGEGAAKFVIWDESTNKVVYNRLQSLNVSEVPHSFKVCGHDIQVDWFYYKGERKAKIPENML